MVQGCGIDIVDIRRIDKLITRYGAHFLTKIFSPAEQRYCNAKASPAIHFAGRWAAKEAFYKAIPPSCQAVSFWQSIEILPSEGTMKPAIRVLSAELNAALEYANICGLHLSISHEKEYCIAFVIIGCL
jgi:holo-[acyl-carrier protein] synthase